MKSLYNRLPVKKPRGKNKQKENESTEEGHDNELQLISAKKPNMEKVLLLLKDSFSVRRKFINSVDQKDATKKILSKYPLMGHYEELSLPILLQHDL